MPVAGIETPAIGTFDEFQINKFRKRSLIAKDQEQECDGRHIFGI
jgi:hypothetical protein